MEHAVCRKCAPIPHIWEQAKVEQKQEETKELVISSSENSRAFLTTNFTEVLPNYGQVILVGCFLDLPYQVKNEHIFTPTDNRGVTVKAGSPMIMYQRAILEKDVEKDHDLLVVHRYINYRPDERHYGYGEGEGEYGYGEGEGEYSEDDYGEHYEGNENEQDD